MADRYQVTIGYTETRYVERVVVVKAGNVFEARGKAAECDIDHEEDELVSQPRERREVQVLSIPRKLP